MIEPLALSFDRPGFLEYVEGIVAQKMGAWRPRGFVLHATGAPTLAQFYQGPHGPISGPQRVKNTWVSYQQQGWSGGPHLFVTDKEILLANPLWLRGTHSPSWNATYWGLEMAGNYSTEKLPDALRDNAITALAALYGMLGQTVSATNFHFHAEDPRTTHKMCPGPNVGPKAGWVARLNAEMVKQHPGDHAHPPLVA